MDLVPTLQGVGFTLYESKAISACLEFGQAATAVEIANRAGIPVTKVYSVLKALENRGILESGFERPKKYSCLSVEELKERLVQEKKREQERIARALEEGVSKSRRRHGSVSVFWGKGELKKRLFDSLKKQGPVRVALSSEDSLKESRNPYVLRNAYKKARKGEQVRIILCGDWLENACIESLAILSACRARTVGAVVPSMVLSEEEAVIGLHDLGNRPVGGVHATDPETVKELRGYYDLLWEQSQEPGVRRALEQKRREIAGHG